jgi:predicted O-methyltransferase YrrM
MRAELQNLPTGWFNHGEKILDLVEKYRPCRCVELGTWHGASAIAIARMIRSWGGCLTCVDTWSGSLETKKDLPILLAECAKNIVAAGVGPSIRFIPSLTMDAALWWNGEIDFLYIDADHSYETTRRDIELWWRFLRIGGLICGDDYGSTLFPGVAQAWDEFEKHTQPFERHVSPGLEPGMQLIYGVKHV